MCQSDIRDQARCGSCWAVAAAEAFEDRICIKCNGKHKAKIGAQELVSCNYASFGCSGGFPWAAWEYYALFGSVTEDCFPYTSGKGDSGSCPFFSFLLNKCPNRNTTYKSYKIHHVEILMGEKYIMQDMLEHGPVEVGFTVFEDFMSYNEGIYEPTTTKQVGGHAVKLIGWGTENGVDYWIAANSWGPRWGENGYFRIKRGTSLFAMFGFAGVPITEHVC